MNKEKKKKKKKIYKYSFKIQLRSKQLTKPHWLFVKVHYNKCTIHIGSFKPKLRRWKYIIVVTAVERKYYDRSLPCARMHFLLKRSILSGLANAPVSRLAAACCKNLHNILLWWMGDVYLYPIPVPML